MGSANGYRAGWGLHWGWKTSPVLCGLAFALYFCGKFANVEEDFRKPTSKVAHNREEQEDYRISTGSAKLLTLLGFVLVVPGIVMLVWEAERNIGAGIGFIILGLATAWTGVGARILFRK